MTTNYNGRDLLFGALGLTVQRATAALPQTATGNLFQVTGGRIVLRALVGQVTTIVGATVTTAKVSGSPTVGTAVDLAAATAVTSLEVGGLITLPLTLGGALQVNTAGAGEIPMSLGFLVAAGFITLTTSASDTGAVKWTACYIPFDPGAALVAV